MNDDKPKDSKSDSNGLFVSIDLTGKDKEIWDRQRPKFVARLINNIKSLWDSQVPGRTTVHEEAKKTLFDLAASAQDIIKSPQLKNMEKEAEIIKKMSEAKLNNSKARKIDAEAALIEEVHNSQKVIESLMNKGELYPEIKDGKLHIIFKPMDDAEAEKQGKRGA